MRLASKKIRNVIATGMRDNLKIKVKFFAYLRDIFQSKELEVELETGATVRELLNHLCDFTEARYEVFEGTELKPHLVIFRNGIPVHTAKSLETELHEGDTLNIFPFIGGG